MVDGTLCVWNDGLFHRRGDRREGETTAFATRRRFSSRSCSHVSARRAVYILRHIAHMGKERAVNCFREVPDVPRRAKLQTQAAVAVLTPVQCDWHAPIKFLTLQKLRNGRKLNPQKNKKGQDSDRDTRNDNKYSQDTSRSVVRILDSNLDNYSSHSRPLLLSRGSRV